MVLATVPLACGGSTDGDPGSGGTAAGGGTAGASGGSGGNTGGTAGIGGSGGSVGGSGGGSGGMPPTCQVPAAGPGPYPVTFRFNNLATAPYYIVEGCSLQYQVTSCADGYVKHIARSGDCTTDCSEKDFGCIACGACPFGAKEVTSAFPVDGNWAGYEYTFEQTKQFCDCHVQHVAPAGKYRIQLNVFASEQDALNGTVSHEVSVDFTLPAPGGMVDVPLHPSSSGG